MTRTLVAGWFSFPEMGATAGDLIARDLTCEWLDHAGRSYDVALVAPFEGGVDWREADAEGYDSVVFVCGPFGNGPPLVEFLERFSGCRLIGLNVSMLEPLEAWNPFDLLLERDSSERTRPDISLLSGPVTVPVVARVLVHPQKEYSGRMHEVAHAAIRRLLATRELAVVPVDTRLDVNDTGLRTPGEVEAAIARVDAVVTTRLHGMVLALKNGVPPLAIDPIAGGAKIRHQAEEIGWPATFTADRLDEAELRRALDFCLSAEGREQALACRTRAVRGLARVREQFVAAMAVERRPAVG